MKTSTAARSPQAARRGIATIWTVLTVPVLMTLLLVVLEAAHLWHARAELQAGLEAAALAGVKVWAEASETNAHATPGALAFTNAGREAAQAAAAGNVVSGQSLALSLNEADDGNNQTGFDNASCTGHIVLGGFPTTGTTSFFSTADVGCGRTTTTTTSFAVTFNITVDTRPAMVTGDTSNIANAFTVSYTTTGTGISVSQMQIDLRHTGGAQGTFQSGAAFPGGSEAGGAGPNVHATSNVTAGETSFAFNGGSTAMTASFTSGAWISGESFIFGVDTDRVRVNGPHAMEPPISVVDEGGDFGLTGANNNTLAGEVIFRFAFNTPGGTTTLTDVDVALSRTGATRSNLQGKQQQFNFTVTVVIPDVDFAVMTQKTHNVTPLFSQIFGVPMGSIPITGRAIATARCVGGNSVLVQNPQAVHYTAVNCP